MTTSLEKLGADRAASTSSGWCSVPLDEVCEERTGIRDPHSRPNEDFSYIDISAVDNKAKRIVEAKRLAGSEAPSRARQVVRAGDVLVSTTRPNLNAVAMVPPELDDQICSTGFCVLRPKPNLAREFLFAYVQSAAFVERLSSLVKGALYPAVTDRQVRSQMIPLPPLAEQKRIASALAEQMTIIEKGRAALHVQMDAGFALREALLRQAFCEIIPLADGGSKDQAPSGWRWHKLIDFARLESGHTPSRNHPEWWGGSVPWIALSDIRALDGKVANATLEYTNEAGLANSSARLLPANTVVLSRTASVGFVTIMGRPMATSQDFVNWVCGPDLDPRFLMRLFRASRERLIALASGAIHKTIYMNVVEQFRVCVPPIGEQRRIADLLDTQLPLADKIAADIQARLTNLEALPTRILSEAFAGAL